MSKYYTNVSIYGSSILLRGVNNGKRFNTRVKYSPTVFLPSKKKTEWKTLFGECLEPMKFSTMREGKDFYKQYDSVENFKIYGNDRFEYSFISENHPGQIDWDINHIDIAIVDIEVGSDNGFPDPNKAEQPITAIAVHRLNGGIRVYGCGTYVNHNDNVIYFKCKDEHDLCRKFLDDWIANCPDVITGWNTKFFDIPYLINRITRVLGEDEASKLSPWNNLYKRETMIQGRKEIVHQITGVAALDYIELYRWYAPGGKSQESYRLDAIAQVELGIGKIAYDEYDSLTQLYTENYQKFIDYNIKDVELIVKLEDKLKLIELALTLAYDTKTNYEDVFAQTRMWDSLIYNHLIERNIVVPPKEKNRKDSAFEGAYVKDPQVGLHNWVASFDLNSLYPHLIIQYNISPETLVQREDYNDVMTSLAPQANVDVLLRKELDTSEMDGITITPNGQFFRTNKQGFLPEMMEIMYKDRKKFKKLMLQAEQEYENEKDEEKRKEIGKSVARYNNLQLAKKVSLNSAYGAMGSQYFRFYDLRIALAVTMAGQLSIRWIENKLNVYLNKLLKTEKDYVIASDTDSIYLNLGPLVSSTIKTPKEIPEVISFMDKICETKIQPYIDKSYSELAEYVHAYDQKMIMKREALANKGIWTAKKRYILNVYNNEGIQYSEPHMKVMGLEMIKSSTPSAVRDKMRELIKLMMTGTQEDIQTFIATFKEEFRKLPVEDISFPRGVNGLKQYTDSATLYKKGTPIHVKGALLYNNYLREKNLTTKYPLIQEGEKLKFAWLKMPNPIKDTVISFPNRLPKEFDIQDYIDYDTQFEKSFIEPIRVILDCLGWETEQSGNTLESFFG